MYVKKQEYAIYKGDDLVDMGTLQELAQRRGIKAKNLLYMGTPTYARRTNPDRATRLVKLEDDE